jgi:predicted enzyme related to lactoylglutathione lyase
MSGHVSLASIPVDEFGRAAAFYAKKLGFHESVDEPCGQDSRIMLQIPGARTGVQLDWRSGERVARPVPPLIAPDASGSISTLRGLGVVILAEPKPAERDEATTYAMIRDSEGTRVLIASR